MPHNLYLHSSLIQTRDYERTKERQEARLQVRVHRLQHGPVRGLLRANASIVILAAAAFHYGPFAGAEVADISQAYELTPGRRARKQRRSCSESRCSRAARTLPSQGPWRDRLSWKGSFTSELPPWLRRMITRFVALVPAVTVAAISGADGTGKLLVLSQVILPCSSLLRWVPWSGSRPPVRAWANL